ncbi:zf-DHHC-domain-containing protein [Laetiporus sulphureus 93-53]|uniref:Palmitoyltransferase n=1 Tax=Laetiporus sulphureus 93-53 TaxID=1314785 RepID=A0A165HI47_9APHY|nr:zf-DHHC-domain-containing protein [Laetiporus sulphureus 93-53]KZT11761.1 zf-DHHC-domain-containing protein [Laetiporus sulphureus 93-53]
MSRRSPLVSPPATPPPRLAQHWDEEDDETDAPTRKKRWYHYMPLFLAVVLMLLPHPSLLIVLVNYHLRVLNSPLQFLTHLTVTYTLSFLAFSSLILILARDPGPVSLGKETETGATSDEEDGMSFMQALLAPDERETQGHGRWCRKCNAPKPERTHHCSTCGRCVLKMDHHCLWLGDRCIGHRTYSAFLHLLTCVSLLSIYIAVLCIEAVYFAFTNPLSIDENTPLHDIYLAFYGIVMALVFGSFWIYHLYLTTTNQTTLEHLSPFLLLRHLPPLPPPISGVKGLSNPPQEFELSYPQRRLVRDAHHHVRLYDVGWRKNWGQVMGWDRPWGWMYRLLVGGGGKGDGKSFPRNPRAEGMLARLAAELVSADKD